MRILVTGGCGFIGSHYIKYLLANYPDAHVLNVDAMTYAAHPDTADYLARLSPHRYQWLKADIASDEIGKVFENQPVEVVVNFAAETHVDRSILDPGAFVRTNIVGVQNLLTLCRQKNIRFVHVSTDEVYGTLSPTDPAFLETTPLEPNSPYAASKASADLLVLASHRTYGQNVMITRCSNNYGPFQFPEKLIPLVVANAIENRPVPVYGDGKQIRDWIFVEDHCSGIAAVMEAGRAGEVYNISGKDERYNIDVVRKILSVLGKPDSLIQHVGDRPGHDRRYALNAGKIRQELDWSPKVAFEEGITRTIDWYLSQREWWQRVRDKEYFAYYQSNYQNKFQTGANA